MVCKRLGETSRVEVLRRHWSHGVICRPSFRVDKISGLVGTPDYIYPKMLRKMGAMNCFWFRNPVLGSVPQLFTWSRVTMYPPAPRVASAVPTGSFSGPGDVGPLTLPTSTGSSGGPSLCPMPAISAIPLSASRHELHPKYAPVARAPKTAASSNGPVRTSSKPNQCPLGSLLLIGSLPA